jgi:hypothetical protein
MPAVTKALALLLRHLTWQIPEPDPQAGTPLRRRRVERCHIYLSV